MEELIIPSKDNPTSTECYFNRYSTNPDIHGLSYPICLKYKYSIGSSYTVNKPCLKVRTFQLDLFLLTELKIFLDIFPQKGFNMTVYLR